MDKGKQERSIASEAIFTEWWNVRRAAIYLGMSESFIRKSVRLRSIPFTKVGSKSVRFSKSEIEKWLRRGGPCG